MLGKEEEGVKGAGGSSDNEDAITNAMTLLDTLTASERRQTLDRLMQLVGNTDTHDVLHSTLRDETSRQVVVVNKRDVKFK